MGFWPVVENVIKNSDILLVVMDARMPELSRNKEIEGKIERFGKNSVMVFTKVDLLGEKFAKDLKKEYPNCFFVSGTKNMGIGELRRNLQIMGKRLKIDNPRVGVIGYPNIGKSALINALARRARSAVADLPGTTRGVQWVNAAGLRIYDTPGVIPYDDRGSKLAMLGSKHPDKIENPDRVALDIIHMCLGKDRKILEERYHIKIKELTAPYDVLLEIGRKRGFLSKGGIVDETKTSINVIRDWQKGKIIVTG